MLLLQFKSSFYSNQTFHRRHKCSSGKQVCRPHSFTPRSHHQKHIPAGGPHLTPRGGTPGSSALEKPQQKWWQVVRKPNPKAMRIHHYRERLREWRDWDNDLRAQPVNLSRMTRYRESDKFLSVPCLFHYPKQDTPCLPHHNFYYYLGRLLKKLSREPVEDLSTCSQRHKLSFHFPKFSITQDDFLNSGWTPTVTAYRWKNNNVAQFTVRQGHLSKKPCKRELRLLRAVRYLFSIVYNIRRASKATSLIWQKIHPQKKCCPVHHESCFPSLFFKVRFATG